MMLHSTVLSIGLDSVLSTVAWLAPLITTMMGRKQHTILQ